MIAVVDYGVGNLASVTNALKRIGEQCIVTNNNSLIRNSSAIILPGVGAAGEGMGNLRREKMINLLKNLIKEGKPFLGICLGMQLLFEKSEEGNIECLSVLKGSVVRYQKERKIPQIGWNKVRIYNTEFGAQNKITKLFSNLPNNSYFYFVNSYYCDPSDKNIIVATAEYGEEFASIVAYGNIVATQFHPEKSGKAGFQFLINWCKYYVN